MSHRVRMGAIEIDALTLPQAVDAIEALISSRRGGFVVTPNVDHVVRAQTDPDFRGAYAAARLSLVDGTPVLWAARVLGAPLPERISGSDLVAPLCARAAQRGWRVFVLGGPPGTAERAAAKLRERHGVQVVGAAGPTVTARGDDPGTRGVLEQLEAARPDLVLVGFGSPKQELWLHRHAARLAPAVGVAVGAAIDFAAGRLTRAPRWMSRSGLEWAYRLGQEPRRLWRRYLLDDPKFFGIVLGQLAART